VTVTPERILDTRDPNNVGLSGPFVSAVSQKLQVTGSIPTATGPKLVVPTGATGVLLNVTPVGATADGFISIRPGDATGAATTSSLNFTTGDILPNAVQVGVPTAGANAGQIDITFDAYGQAGPTTDILIDVVGYTTSAGLQELVADVATKANATDVYTKTEVDAKLASTVNLQVGIASATADNDSAEWSNGCVSQTASPFTVRLGVDLPIGATITALTGYMRGSGATLELRRTTGVTTGLVTVTSTSAGLASVSADLVTPEAVNVGDFFYLEFDGGGTTPQLCGASIEYTIAPGTSLQLDAPDTGGDGLPAGQE